MLSFEKNIVPLYVSYYEAGRALYSQKKFEEALQYLIKASSHFEHTEGPVKMHSLHYALGKTYHELEKDHESLENYFLSFINDPQHSPEIIKEAQEILNDTLVTQRLNFCKDWVYKLKSLNVSAEAQQELSILLGRIYMLNENSEDNPLAEGEFNLVLQQNPLHLYALENLGEVYRRTGRFEEALALFNRVSAEDNTGERKDFINLRKAMLYFDEGDYEQVLNYTSNLSFQHSFHKALVQKMRAKSFIYANRPEQAKEEADKILVTDESNFPLMLIKAIACIYLADYANALFYLNKCLSHESNNEEYLFYNAQALIEGFIDAEQGKKILHQLSKSFVSKMLVQQVQITLNTNGNNLLFLACLQSASDDALTNDAALTTLENAIKAGIKAKNSYPELYAYQLKGDILASKKQNENAADAYFEAAKRLYWQADYKEATAYFQKAIGQKNNDANIFWYSADNYLMQSFLTAYPFSDKQTVDNAYDHWKKGIALKLPGANEAWSYITKARLHELLHNYTEGTDEDEYRKASYYAEQSIFLSYDDYFNLAFLARYLRFCGLDVNALAILNRAEEKNKDFILTKEEKAGALLNLGYWQQALQYLNILDDEDKKPGYEGWRGYLHFNEGNYEKALTYFDKAIEAAPENAWNRLMRIQTYWHLNNADSSYRYNDPLQKDAEWLYAKKDAPEYRKEIVSIAFASIFAEKDLKRTEGLFQSLLMNDDQKGMANLYLSYFYLKNGVQKSATKAFNEYFKYSGNMRQLLAVKKDIAVIASEAAAKYPELKKWCTQITNEEGSSETSWFAKINAALDQLAKNPLSSEKEIEEKLSKNLNYKPGTFGFKALQLRLAQLKLDEKDYEEAFSIYSSLLPANNEEIFTIENLCIRLRSVIKDMQHFWQAERHISQMLAANSFSNEYEKIFYQQLLLQLQMPLSEEYSLNKVVDAYPEVTPLVVEVAANLVPADPNAWPLIKEGFPKLRQQILESYGIRLPGIRIRGNEGDLQHNVYDIMLDEVPLVLNYLYPGYVYCPHIEQMELKKLNIPDEDIKSVDSTLLDKANKIHFWIKKEHLPLLNQNKAEVYEDHFEVLLNYLKAFVIKNLAEFFGIDNCDELIKGLREKGTLLHLKTEDFEMNVHRKIKFTKMLKALLYEKVPITNLAAIVDSLTVNDLDKTDITTIIIKLREVLKAQLPGNDYGRIKAELPETIENKLAAFITEDEEKRQTLVIPPEETQKILDEFKKFVQNNANTTAIVVQDPLTRVYAKRLFEIEFPDVDFLSANEVIKEEHITLGKEEYITFGKEEYITLERMEKRIDITKHPQPQSTNEPLKKCPKCGYRVEEDWRFCINCGQILPETVYKKDPENMQAAIKSDTQKIIGSSSIK